MLVVAHCVHHLIGRNEKRTTFVDVQRPTPEVNSRSLAPTTCSTTDNLREIVVGDGEYTSIADVEVSNMERHSIWLADVAALDLKVILRDQDDAELQNK